ncbi:hypothetical protein MicB006_0896 [Micromonospora sp. B006]|nr:hypothetical protein MicB006_0896 [Micromonospora sp. B006]
MTVVMLVGFAALVVAMMALANGSDAVWQRRVYVFGAVQAVVFTAIGWLFGREGSRSTVAAARKDAEAAKQEAAAERATAHEEANRAAKARQVVTETTAKAKAVRAAARLSRQRPRSGVRDVAAPAEGRETDEFIQFVDELFGDFGDGGNT